MQNNESKEVQEAIKKIEAIIQSLQPIQSGISIEGCTNFSVTDNTLINCGISVTNSKEWLLYGNTIDNSRKLEIIEKLIQLKTSLQDQKKLQVKETMSWLETGATIAYNILSGIDIIRRWSGM